MPITGNKGEWSELYTFLKILGDGKISIGDNNYDVVGEDFFPVLQIIRKEDNDNLITYDRSACIDYIQITGYDINKKLPVSAFVEKAKILLDAINGSGTTTFAVPEIESFMDEIGCRKIKAKSKDKTDISIVIQDIKTNLITNVGYSIKSLLGSPPTLINSTKATNVLYKIDGDLTVDDVMEINSINPLSGKIQKRIEALISRGCKLKYADIPNRTFRNNLTMIDSLLPEIVAEAVLFYFTTSSNKIKDIVEIMTTVNPLGYDFSDSNPFYKYKILQLLTDSAFGMLPASTWEGIYNANGGFIIVKKTGDLICFPIYYKNSFDNYLFNNTRFDTGSSTKNGFGMIEKIGDNYFFRLNVQVRFL